MLIGLIQDVRFGLRGLVRAPGFTLVAVAILALGIGANTAIFSVVNAVLLRPLPYPDAGRLVSLSSTFSGQGTSTGASSLPDYRAWRDESTAFDNLAGFWLRDFTLTGGGADPEQVAGAYVTTNLLDVLAVAPARGRGFEPADAAYGSHRVVLFSDGLWRRRFGADPNAVGRSIEVAGVPFVVAGILPQGFRFPARQSSVDVLAPLSFPPGSSMNTRRNHFVSLVGRLAPGVSVRQAQQEAAATASQLERTYPENAGVGVRVASLTDELVGPARPRLVLLVGAVGFVLLLAAVNVAGLMVARGTTRAREMAIRAGLGASRTRLASHAVIESVLLGFGGGASGLVLAIWIVHPLVALLPLELPRFNPVAIDPWVYAFAATLSVLAIAGVALAPALQASGSRAGAVQMEDLRTGSGSRSRLQLLDALIVAEVALALALLTGAGLVSRSHWRLQQIDPGFASHGTLTMILPVPAARYSSPEVALAFYETLRERVTGLPGVEAAGAGMFLPLGIYRGFGKQLSIQGRPAPTSRDLVPTVGFSIVSPGFLPALGARITSGRGFMPADSAGARQVAIVNETIARRYFPGESPLGQTIYMGVPESLEPSERQAWPAVRRTIVGVVADIRDEGLQEPASPRVFVPYYQHAGDGWVNTLSFVVRTSGDPTALAPLVADIVHDLDPAQVVASVRPMDEIVAEALAASQSTAILL
ncbi:MAG TPA: ABC transporter permease, partial [Vicinamibacterales bacterium]|nr:ABC transporter permease [Vicinamibacterales bacterium]